MNIFVNFKKTKAKCIKPGLAEEAEALYIKNRDLGGVREYPPNRRSMGEVHEGGPRRGGVERRNVAQVFH